jgi:hypothetical protein
MLKIALIYISLLLPAVLGLTSCDGGLMPIPVAGKSYITGKITYKGGASAWPVKDSVLGIRVAAFQDYPPSDILTEFQNGTAYFSSISLPFFADTTTYWLEIPHAPVNLKYIAVAQQYDSSLFSQRAIGVYTTNGDVNTPSQINVGYGTTIRNINITVDFKNLPPQPFK